MLSLFELESLFCEAGKTKSLPWLCEDVCCHKIDDTLGKNEKRKGGWGPFVTTIEGLSTLTKSHDVHKACLCHIIQRSLY